jgi:predicted RNA polymerase sigma factor
MFLRMLHGQGRFFQKEPLAARGIFLFVFICLAPSFLKKLGNKKAAQKAFEKANEIKKNPKKLTFN